MIKAVIFDWDGVLVDSVKVYFDIFKTVLARKGAQFLSDYYNRFNGPTIEEIFETVRKEQRLHFNVAEAVRERNALVEEGLKRAPLFPHAAETVHAIRAQGLKTAVASGAPRKQIDPELLDSNIPMDAVVTADDVVNGKPHPEVYLKASESIGIPPAHCIAVEDSPMGIKAAKAAGMHVVGITTTTNADELHEADVIIHHIQELTQVPAKLAKKQTIAAVVQARLGSSRFPQKVLKEINGVPMLQFLVNRLQKSKKLNDIIIATTDSPQDDKLVDSCKQHGWKYYRGSEEDVLDRYYQAAKEFGVDAVVRITADCPLVDPAIVDQLIDEYKKGGADYVCNVHPPTYPDGLDVEVFSFDALERAWKISREKPNLALVTGHILNHPDQFKIRNVLNDQDLSAYRFTVDYPEDLEMVSKLCSLIRKDDFGLRDMMAALMEHPELRALNAKFKRNEGMILDMKKLAEGKKL